MTSSVRKGWFGRRFLLAVAAVVAVLGARAEDLAINVAADQTATYDQDATVTSVTLGSKAIASLTGVHTYTLTATALTLGSDSVFNVADGATLAVSSANGVNFGSGRDFTFGLSNATVSVSGAQSFMAGTISQINPGAKVLSFDGTSPSMLLESALDVGDSEVTYSRNYNAQQSGNVYIFAASDKSKGSSIALYAMKIWNTSGTLVRDFVPCRRVSDGLLGLYDLADHSGETDYVPFYTNVWTVTKPFSAPQKTCGAAPADGFERIAWIKADGNQMINTGVSSYGRIEFTFNSGKYASAKVLFGNAWGQNKGTIAYFDVSSKHSVTLFADNQNYDRGRVVDYRDYKVTMVNTGSRSTKLELLPASQPHSLATGLTFGETAAGRALAADELTLKGGPSGGSSSGSIAVFGVAADTTHCSTIALYSMTVVKSGVTVRDLVPVRRSDGVLGLYDLADHSDDPDYNPFYENDGNTAKPFSAPAESLGEVVPGFERVAYLQSNGSQRIKLGVSYGTGVTVSLRFNSLTCVSGKAIIGASWGQNVGCVAFLNSNFTWFSQSANKNCGAYAQDTDYQLDLSQSQVKISSIKRFNTPMQLKFAPTAENFAAAPIRSTAKCRGIVVGDATKIEVVEPDGMKFARIPLISDVGGFAGSPLNAAKLATLTANATLPKGMELWCKESDKTLYARRKQGLIIVVQ